MNSLCYKSKITILNIASYTLYIVAKIGTSKFYILLILILYKSITDFIDKNRKIFVANMENAIFKECYF